MSSRTHWTWVWVDFGSWWRTGRPGVLRFIESQIVEHDWVTEMNWTELNWEECGNQTEEPNLRKLYLFGGCSFFWEAYQRTKDMPWWVLLTVLKYILTNLAPNKWTASLLAKPRYFVFLILWNLPHYYHMLRLLALLLFPLYFFVAYSVYIFCFSAQWLCLYSLVIPYCFFRTKLKTSPHEIFSNSRRSYPFFVTKANYDVFYKLF